MRAPTSVRRHTALLIQASSQNIALKSQDFLPSGLFCSLCEASQATGASKALGVATEMRTGLLALPAVSENIAFNSSSSSYLQILLILPARPPRQLELAKMWAENWSMGGKVSNGLILNSNQQCCLLWCASRGPCFPFSFQFGCYRVASLLCSLIYSEGLQGCIELSQPGGRHVASQTATKWRTSPLTCNAAGTKSMILQTWDLSKQILRW